MGRAGCSVSEVNIPILWTPSNIQQRPALLGLARCGVGCHMSNAAMDNFSYADDLVVLAPTARGLNILLQVCKEFADLNDVKFNTEKSVCMAIRNRDMDPTRLPSIYLGNTVLTYVEEFKYLGHHINEAFTDDQDIQREMRSLYARGNTIIRKLGFLPLDLKCSLFKSYCYSLSGASVWRDYKQATLYRLKVCYNSIMRKLAYVAPWQSASAMFVTMGIRSFDESLRAISYGLMSRINESSNDVVTALNYSDAGWMSRLRARWHDILFVN